MLTGRLYPHNNFIVLLLSITIGVSCSVLHQYGLSAVGTAGATAASSYHAASTCTHAAAATATHATTDAAAVRCQQQSTSKSASRTFQRV